MSYNWIENILFIIFVIIPLFFWLALNGFEHAWILAISLGALSNYLIK